MLNGKFRRPGKSIKGMQIDQNDIVFKYGYKNTHKNDPIDDE